MSRKESLLFIAQCLTILSDKENRAKVLSKVKNKDLNWDEVVKTSTEHRVFPALYSNLKKSNILNHVPKDLVSYMTYISNLNKERNLKIIEQANEINSILISNDIKPIFLKGTAFLLTDLYNDISERMVGDIDFIIPIKDYKKCIKILYKSGYKDQKHLKYHFPESERRHYRRIIKKNHIAAIEVHHSLTKKKYVNEFNYNFIKKNIQNINGFNVMGFQDQLNLSIISDQINDNGYYYRTISLKHAYDIYLLSKKTSAKISFNEFKKLKKPMNNFLAVCYYIFGKSETLIYDKNRKTEEFLAEFNSLLENENKHRFRTKLKTCLKSTKVKLTLILKSVFINEYRIWFINRILDKVWQDKRLKK